MAGKGWLASFRLSNRLFFLAAVLIALVFVAWVYRRQIELSYRLTSAKGALAERKFDAAIASLDKAQAAGENSPEWHFVRARATRRAGRLKEAETHLVRAAKLAWSDADIDRERMLLAAQSGRIQTVRPRLESLLQTDISDEIAEEVYEAMSKGFMTSFDVPEAVRCMEFWSKFQPHNPLPHVYLAELCERLDNPSQAAMEAGKALALDPTLTEARLKKGRALLVQLKLEEADREFQQCRAELPESPVPLLSLSEISRRRGRIEEAKSYLYDALILELTPEQAGDALTALGQMALEEQEPADGIQLLEQAVATAPRQSTNRLALAAALTAAGREDLAAPHRELGIKFRDQQVRHKLLAGRLAGEPGNADVRTEIGLNLIEQGFLAAGADWLNSALQFDDEHPGANRGLARYYEQTGRPEQAREHRRKADQAEAARPVDQSGKASASSP